MMGTKSLQFLVTLLCLFFYIENGRTQSNTISVNVGAVLDMDHMVGKLGLSCIAMAISDFYDTHAYYKTRLVLHTRDSKRSVVGAAAAGAFLLFLFL